MRGRYFTVFISILILLLIFLSAGCTSTKIGPVEYKHVCGDGVCTAEEVKRCNIDCELGIEAEPTVTTTEDVIAELRNRQRNYTPEERLEQENPVVQNDEKLMTESFTTYVPETGFRVADRYNLLSIGENITDILFILDKFHLREVLKSGRLSMNTEAFGPRAALSEQFLRFGAGRVVFDYERDADVISTYLLFEEEEPIIDYLLQLHGGIFKFFEGHPISFLGHEYIITEVSADSMLLVGVTIPDTLLFRDGHGVWINDKVISNEVLNVTFEEESLRVILGAQDEVRILPGTSLTEYLKEPEVMLTNRLDVAYEGLTYAPMFDIVFNRKSNGYKLSFTTNKNMSYNVPIVNFNPFKTGDDKHSFVAQEGDSKSDYFIKEEDYFVVTNNRDSNGLTNIIRLKSVKEDSHVIVLEDPALEKFLVYFKGTLGVNASAELIIDNVLHKIYVGENDTISVDLDGNGKINNDIVPIVTAGSGIIELEEVAGDAVIFQLITPKEMRENSNDDLVVSITIREDGLSVDSNDLKMIREKKLDALIGMTDYGTLLILEEYSDSTEQVGEDLIIKYPLFQRFADVIVKAYE